MSCPKSIVLTRTTLLVTSMTVVDISIRYRTCTLGINWFQYLVHRPIVGWWWPVPIGRQQTIFSQNGIVIAPPPPSTKTWWMVFTNNLLRWMNHTFIISTLVPPQPPLPLQSFLLWFLANDHSHFLFFFYLSQPNNSLLHLAKTVLRKQYCHPSRVTNESSPPPLWCWWSFNSNSRALLINCHKWTEHATTQFFCLFHRNTRDCHFKIEPQVLLAGWYDTSEQSRN